MQILKMTNTNMTIFGYLGSETPQSFGAQIYLYPIMQALAANEMFQGSPELHFGCKIKIYASEKHLVTK